MVVTALCLVLGTFRGDKVELRPGKGKVSLEVQGRPYDSTANPKIVWLNGKATRSRLPGDYRVIIRGYTPKGRVFGSFEATFSGAYSGLNSFAFHTLNGKVELIPNSRRGEGYPVAFKAPNQIIGLEYDGFPGRELGESRVVSWGWLLNGAKVISLGPADAVRFNPKGAVEGYCECDEMGVAGHSNLTGWKPHYRSFTWLGGKRIEGSVSSSRPFR
ncbi:MAG: hypothetical protein ABL949_11275 [Fimbriimonadaceae bacterium]